ncbi:MAG TPA: DUF6328 family protein [Arthrobacter sp.]|nr:DUF6328 family protein [Arthrobacter sp.]
MMNVQGIGGVPHHGQGSEPASSDKFDDGRGETENQRLDRNWVELLQELRVMQTGIQILTGFLLTLPFQSKFQELDTFQVVVYLCLVVGAVVVTALILTSVNLHRAIFGLHIKKSLVTNTDRTVRLTMVLVSLVLAGTAGFIFDIVVGRFAGIFVFGLLLTAVILLWAVYPYTVRRRATRARANGA